eukprot:TRINITY_DN52720_c0_g2_i1.p1 TRINITY_DN52720_c0_g2~~TRINITY_DN52720_c0_g2_i1.p1  ORF type:complete len:1264 (-),score=346.69 TRINITY_DN52720_c0_g2_i1:393-3812(-)
MAGSWDFCVSRGMTSRGWTCVEDCGRHGRSYSWCKTANGQWDYCSSVDAVPSGHDDSQASNVLLETSDAAAADASLKQARGAAVLSQGSLVGVSGSGASLSANDEDRGDEVGFCVVVTGGCDDTVDWNGGDTFLVKRVPKLDGVILPSLLDTTAGAASQDGGTSWTTVERSQCKMSASMRKKNLGKLSLRGCKAECLEFDGCTAIQHTGMGKRRNEQAEAELAEMVGVPVPEGDDDASMLELDDGSKPPGNQIHEVSGPKPALLSVGTSVKSKSLGKASHPFGKKKTCRKKRLRESVNKIMDMMKNNPDVDHKAIAAAIEHAGGLDGIPGIPGIAGALDLDGDGDVDAADGSPSDVAMKAAQKAVAAGVDNPVSQMKAAALQGVPPAAKPRRPLKPSPSGGLALAGAAENDPCRVSPKVARACKEKASIAPEQKESEAVEAAEQAATAANQAQEALDAKTAAEKQVRKAFLKAEAKQHLKEAAMESAAKSAQSSAKAYREAEKHAAEVVQEKAQGATKAANVAAGKAAGEVAAREKAAQATAKRLQAQSDEKVANKAKAEAVAEAAAAEDAKKAAEEDVREAKDELAKVSKDARDAASVADQWAKETPAPTPEPTPWPKALPPPPVGTPCPTPEPETCAPTPMPDVAGKGPAEAARIVAAAAVKSCGGSVKAAVAAGEAAFKAATTNGAKCNTWNCPAGYLSKPGYESLTCAKSQCTLDDIATCCDKGERAKCSSYSCPSGKAQRPMAFQLECSGRQCTQADVGICCVDAPPPPPAPSPAAPAGAPPPCPKPPPPKLMAMVQPSPDGCGTEVYLQKEPCVQTPAPTPYPPPCQAKQAAQAKQAPGAAPGAAPAPAPVPPKPKPVVPAASLAAAAAKKSAGVAAMQKLAGAGVRGSPVAASALRAKECLDITDKLSCEAAGCTFVGGLASPGVCRPMGSGGDDVLRDALASDIPGGADLTNSALTSALMTGIDGSGTDDERMGGGVAAMVSKLQDGAAAGVTAAVADAVGGAYAGHPLAAGSVHSALEQEDESSVGASEAPEPAAPVDTEAPAPDLAAADAPVVPAQETDAVAGVKALLQSTSESDAGALLQDPDIRAALEGTPALDAPVPAASDAVEGPLDDVVGDPSLDAALAAADVG